ncbi:flippase-like domain-containing protein [Clostridiaceae bacterium DONG20-135]|uniref:Phosphatidylglycerol lysyltransferase n=1 Tax=Copranaerobaculum intestinale TaxID=2692629 RepID=A0A6N8U3E1_9FIRM|nr:lysylphosphatidylglycerol synthase transmembrane domain-containing protein [Copranaerobaculum intestinale]MXQ72702.1 flippase-like domain-containing protein [Copranaerobaculum intestinale]
MNQSLKKRIFNIILLLALTAFALWFALKDDYQDVLNNLKHLPLRWLLLILALGILYYVLQGIALYLIGHTYKKDLHIIDGIDNAYIAAFFNGVTPLGGGQVAQTYAFRKLHMKYADIASILWMDFFIFQSVVLLYAGFFIIFRFSYAMNHFPQFLPLIILGYLVNSSVIIGLWTVIRFPTFYQKVSTMLLKLLHRIRIVKDAEKTAEKWNKQILYFQQEVNNLKQHKTLILQCAGLYIIRQTLFYSMPFLVAHAIGLSLQLSDLLNIMAISAFIHMLNALTPLPGDTGWTETAFIILYSILFGKADAGSVMILWRMSTYHLNVVIGGIRFMRVKSKKYPIQDTNPIVKTGKNAEIHS